MRTLVISDIHANLTALNAVLEDAAPFDRVWCLGDVVGYGPDPNACIEIIKHLPSLKIVKGNHDAAILGEINIHAFNFEAQASLQWLKARLKPENKRWLASLEEVLTFDSFTITHGSPRNPIWEYIMDANSARENMDEFETPICLVGHTHIPCAYVLNGNGRDPSIMRLHHPPGEYFSLSEKSILNPGSVGQPRDQDPRACYMIYDNQLNSLAYYRVRYDVEQVQGRILAEGLPERHADRLKTGR